MVKSHLEQDDLNEDHKYRLNEERNVVFLVGPVKYPQKRRNQHNERNIEREASAGLISVHRYDLVAVGEDGRHYEEEGGYKARQIGEPTHDVEKLPIDESWKEDKIPMGEKESIS